MSEELKQRAEFENALGNGYDYTKEPDAWARPRYKQTHIEAMFNGWQLARRTPDTSAKQYSAEDVAVLMREQRKFIKSLGFDPDNLPADEIEHYEQCSCCGNFARMEAKHDSAAELVRELVSGLEQIASADLPQWVEELTYTLKTKAEQWLKKEGGANGED